MDSDPEVALFEQYHREYAGLSTAVERTISSLATCTDSREQSNLVSQAQTKLAEMDAALKKMKMEKNSLTDFGKSRRCDVKVKELEKDARTLRTTFTKTQESLQASSRSKLMSDATSRSGTTAVRGQMLQNDAMLARSQARLEEGRAALAETEDIGNNTILSLVGQRETLERARDSLTNTDSRLTDARKIMTQMSRRLAANKVIMWTIIGGLLALVCFVLFYKVL